MRVLFVASIYHHFTTFHIPYMKHLQDKGYEIWAVGANNPSEERELTKEGFTCIDIPFNRSPLSKDNIQAYKDLKELFKNKEFDLVHVHTPIAALLTRLAFRHSKNRKIIYTAHGFHFYKGAPLLNWLLYYPLEQLATRWTDLLITINNEDYKRAKKMGFAENSISHVHGVGVESKSLDMTVEMKSKLKQSLGVPNEAVVISYVAEINRNKNHLYLLKNWQRIKEASPASILLLIGEGNMKEELARFIEENQLDDIRLLGFRNDVHEILQITDVVSLLSYREGLPKSIMEAMVASIPCIVSDTRGLRDLITNGESGFVIPHKNDELLVDSFVSLLNSEQLRKKMGISAYRNIEPYRLKNVLKEYIEIYDKVLRE